MTLVQDLAADWESLYKAGQYVKISGEGEHSPLGRLKIKVFAR